MERLTFLLAVIGYAGLTATAILAARGRLPIALWRGTAVVIAAHVALVWAIRYEWSLSQATRNGYAGFLVFHSALAVILTSLFLKNRAASALVRIAFVIVSLGAIGAVFRYSEVAVYRAPVLVLAVAGAIGVARGVWLRTASAGMLLGFLLTPALLHSKQGVPGEPKVHTYRQIDGRALSAHVFVPSRTGAPALANAILLFHGGGWNAGAPDWTFDAARRFADAGLVAIAVQYRLSEGRVTPIEALQDVCAAFEWTRKQAAALGIGGRVAGYGVSAGGHLVAATVTVGCPNDTPAARVGPDALLLWSPALDVTRDGWFARLLQGRATAAAYSPADHVRATTPPTSIVHGERDTLTPLSGARRYCDRLNTLGGRCELNAYPGVGHLLTRNLANQESNFDPDPASRADGIGRHVTFLKVLGLVAK